ncbi:LysR family transcriptional regulator [Xanthomonadaceae bacterium JHOS43]|nr:LysR family transcriptional regulator [Xanthomonadaceae bacterium JHOS43]MCX7564041.1 LysR family transcriptional regulator [Xanthomonadaceae bacterium XH05]
MKTSRALPSLNALRAFEAIVRLGSVTRAAAELHVTHGAVSRHLHALEDELGHALFRREGRGITPTSAGLRLAESASSAFSQLREACHRLREDAAQAPIVLGCAASVMARWIIPRLSQLEADLPHLRLHLSPQETLPDATLTGLDAALLLAAPPWPARWRVRDLAPERIGPVLAPHHPAAGDLRDAMPASLLEHPLLHTTSRPQAWPDWATRFDLDPAALQYGTGFAHLYYLLEAAVAGLGIAIAPEPLVSEDIRVGRLVAPWGFLPTDARWVLCTPREHADPRLAELAEWLARALGP